MEHRNIENELSSNAYPGRGIIVGRSDDDKNAVIAYFIMGRSANSRNRVFTKKHNGIITEAADPAKLEDPSLIIYSPVRVFKNTHIVTNGDQTDTVYEGMTMGKSFARSLRKRTFEPDAPNFTPRISAIVKVKNNKMTFKMSILKSSNGNGNSVERMFYEYPMPLRGEGRFIHTYKCDGNPIPSFEGEPETIKISGKIDEFTSSLWHSLNEENKVSLFVRYINIETGEFTDKIVNKYEKTKG